MQALKKNLPASNIMCCPSLAPHIIGGLEPPTILKYIRRRKFIVNDFIYAFSTNLRIRSFLPESDSVRVTDPIVTKIRTDQIQSVKVQSDSANVTGTLLNGEDASTWGCEAYTENLKKWYCNIFEKRGICVTLPILNTNLHTLKELGCYHCFSMIDWKYLEIIASKSNLN